MGNVARTPRLLDVNGASISDRVLSSQTGFDVTSQRVPRHNPNLPVNPPPTHIETGFVVEGGKATITATWNLADKRWDSVVAQITSDPLSINVERINRLLSRMNAPRLETYWRTKTLTVKAPGKRLPLPVRLHGALVVSSTTSWSWSVTKTGHGTTPIPAAKTATVAPAGAHIAVGSKAASATLSGPLRGTKTAAQVAMEKAEAILAESLREQAEAPVPVAPPTTPVIKVPAIPAGGTFHLPKALPFKVHLDKDVEEGLERSLRIHLSMKPRTYTVAALRGPSGTGKTLAAEHLAAVHGLPYAKFDAAGMVTFADWVGAVSLDSDEKGVVTRFAPSAFIEAVRADGPYAGVPRVVLIDEITRVSGTSAANALLPMLDGSSTIYVPDARQHIQIDRAVFFIVTANIGSQYGGTVTLDAALVNRIKSWLRVPYPSAEVEASIVREQSGCSLQDAQKLVRVATQTRALAANRTIDSLPVSTRQLVAAGLHIAFGATPLQAAMVAFVDSYDDEGGAQSERAHVLTATEGVLRGG